MDVPKPIRVLGIDLGTTNSTVSETIWERDKSLNLDIRCLEIDQETQSGLYTHTLIPSAVAIHNGREWIGEGAKRLHVRAPEFGLELPRTSFWSVKTILVPKEHTTRLLKDIGMLRRSVLGSSNSSKRPLKQKAHFLSLVQSSPSPLLFRPRNALVRSMRQNPQVSTFQEGISSMNQLPHSSIMSSLTAEI